MFLEKVKVNPSSKPGMLGTDSLNENANPIALKLVTVDISKNKFETKTITDSDDPLEAKELVITNPPEIDKKGASALSKTNMIDSKTLRKIGSSTSELLSSVFI